MAVGSWCRLRAGLMALGHSPTRGCHKCVACGLLVKFPVRHAIAECPVFNQKREEFLELVPISVSVADSSSHRAMAICRAVLSSSPGRPGFQQAVELAADLQYAAYDHVLA